MRSGRMVVDQKIIGVFAIYSVQMSPVIGAPEPGIAQAEVVLSSVYRIDPPILQFQKQREQPMPAST